MKTSSVTVLVLSSTSAAEERDGQSRSLRHGVVQTGNGNLFQRPSKSDEETDERGDLQALHLKSSSVLRQNEDTPSSSNHAPGCGPTAGTHHSPYLGCFDDKASDRAFSFELYEGQSRDKRLGHGVLECEKECTNRGYQFFGREYLGQCFCGNNLSKITRHGRETGCNCCGRNVGPGMLCCLWENSESSNSIATSPQIEPVMPQESQPVVNDISGHTHLSNAGNNNDNLDTHSVATTPKPVGGFRLRLYWEKGYRWQESSREKWWCMECRGSCSSGTSIKTSKCDSSRRQRFIAIGKTIRPASAPALCMTVRGYDGARDPVRLRRCNHGADQRWNEVTTTGKFELSSESRSTRCMSQHHHPKEGEAVYPADCALQRSHDTSYWTVI